MTRTRPRHATALAALLLLSIAACNNSDATPPPTPQPTSQSTSATPTPTPNQTPTQTPRPEPPTIPPAATSGLTITSAEAFARFYLSALDYTRATGDPTQLRKWANTKCLACHDLANNYEKQYKDGGSVTGDNTFEITKITKVRVIGGDTAEVVLAGRRGRHVDVKTATAKPTTFPGGTVRWQLGLLAVNGHWSMYGMVQQ